MHEWKTKPQLLPHRAKFLNWDDNGLPISVMGVPDAYFVLKVMSASPRLGYIKDFLENETNRWGGFCDGSQAIVGLPILKPLSASDSALQTAATPASDLIVAGQAALAQLEDLVAVTRASAEDASYRVQLAVQKVQEQRSLLDAARVAAAAAAAAATAAAAAAAAAATAAAAAAAATAATAAAAAQNPVAARC